MNEIAMKIEKMVGKPISLFKKFGVKEVDIKPLPMPKTLTDEERGSMVHIPGCGMQFYTGD